LYQAWYQLYQANLPGALNVIVLLTDGRPSAFTGYFTPNGSTTCTNKSQRAAVYETYVTLGSAPFWPPPTSGNDSTGLYATHWTSTPEINNFAANSTNCYYASTTTNLYEDFSGATFPNSVGPVDNVGSGTGYPPGFSTPGTGINTQSPGYYLNPGNSIQDPLSGRYAAFNVADNMAKLIRQDTTLKPMLFVIGLNYAGNSTESLDEDFLARLANDATYQTTGTDIAAGITPGHSVYQAGQTPGMYCNSTTATLTSCFSQISSALLRLTQ
jgi:hypothetical protein